MLRSSNPTLSQKAFQTSHVTTVGGEVMTLDGTINRSIFAVLLTMAAAYWSWTQPQLASMTWIFFIIGLIMALVISFKQSLAPMLTPAYAVVEGLALGSVSLFADTMYPGIAFKAMGLTLGILFSMLMLYKSGAIKVTDRLRAGIMMSMMGILLFYLVTFVLGLFGVNVSMLHDGGMLSIGISLFIIGIASLSLLLDFDFIEQAASSGRAPKYMEWYGAFGLLVSLVWLYIEILNLLMKLNSRD